VNDECLFCKLYREADHAASTEGFVAIRDINPQAETHLLVLPERHVESFREIGAFPPDEAKRMLDFVAEVAADHGLTDYPCRRERRRRSRADDLPPALARAERRTDGENGVSLIATIEDEIKEAMKSRDAERRDALRLIVNALKGSEKELHDRFPTTRAAGPAARRKKRVEAADAFRTGGRERGGHRGARARDPRGVHAGATLGRRDRGDHRTTRSPRWAPRAWPTSVV